MEASPTAPRPLRAPAGAAFSAYWTSDRLTTALNCFLLRHLRGCPDASIHQSSPAVWHVTSPPVDVIALADPLLNLAVRLLGRRQHLVAHHLSNSSPRAWRRRCPLPVVTSERAPRDTMPVPFLGRLHACVATPLALLRPERASLTRPAATSTSRSWAPLSSSASRPSSVS